MAAYTFSKSLDDVPDSGRYLDTSTGDPANLRGSYGLSDFDRSHRLVVSYNQEIRNPFWLNAHGAAAFLKGWRSQE